MREPNSPTLWQPRTARDFAGARNAQTVARLSRELLHWPGPAVVTAPPGLGKTSLVRYLARRNSCRAVPAAGEPCGTCDACRSQTPEYNGERHEHIQYMLDCTRVGPKQLRRVLDRVADADRAFLFLDELNGLANNGGFDQLRTFAEDFRGILVAAVTVASEGEDLSSLIGAALAERLRPVTLVRPVVAEITEVLERNLADWGITQEEGAVRCLAEYSGQSFRRCLQTLAEVQPDGRLTVAVVRDKFRTG
jgi:replication-associated recombination protein RarA